MPDLGAYAGAVLSAYAVSLGLIAALVLVSVNSARKARKALQAVEKEGIARNE